MWNPPENQSEKLREVVNSLSYHAGSGDGKQDKFEALREAAKYFAEVIDGATPASREQALAYTHLEESLMWAIKSIAIRD